MDLTRRREVQKRFTEYSQSILIQDPQINELKDLTEDKKQMVYSMVNMSLFLIHGYVENLQKKVALGKEQITVREAEKLTGILERLNKIVEAEKERSTDDGEFVKPADPKELQTRIIKADVFAQQADVKEEVKEIVKQNKEAAKSVKIHKEIVKEMVKNDEEIINDDDVIISDDDDYFS